MPTGIPNTIESIASRFILDEKTGCHLWTGCLRKGKNHGYSWVTYKNKGYSVHKLLYEHLKGPVPQGLELLHSCHVRKCINMAHLRPDTHRRNMEEMVEAGRASRLTGARGEKHYKVKVSDDDIAKIRELIASGMPNHVVAKMFNLDWKYVSHIKGNTTRKVRNG